MAKRLIWSQRAQRDRKEIFEYWNTRNRSKTYSQKLNRLFKESLLQAAEFPEIGKTSLLNNNLRVKTVKDYLLFYEIHQHEIRVLTIWHGKQNPANLNLKSE